MLKLGVNLRTVPVTTNYSATIFDDIIDVDTSLGSITITLPNATLIPGKSLRINKVDVSLNRVTISGSQTINNQVNYKLFSQFDSVEIVSVNGVWVISSSYFAQSIAASYLSNSGASYSTAQTINFENVDYDPLGLVVTGASWHFTAPLFGLYSIYSEINGQRVSAVQGEDYSILIAATSRTINGPIYHIQTSVTQDFGLSVYGNVRLALNDTVSITTNFGATFFLNAGNQFNQVTIVRIGN